MAIARRDLFQRAALASSIFGVPFARASRALAIDAPPLPPSDLHARDPERYWAALRRQWVIAPERTNLNCGSVGATPLPVLRAVVEHMLEGEAFREPGDPTFGYAETPLIRQVREALATFMGCDVDELALVRNATEGNNVVANGLDLAPGDRVLLTDQEHPGGRSCWELKAARFGVRLDTVELPRPPASIDEIVDRFRKALTPRTRVICASHVTTASGLILPIKEIAALARQRGVLTHVDGAHGVGQMPLDLHDLGCDFYATSPHKWLQAPKGTGALFIRKEHLERLWAHTASASWRDTKLGAYRFSHIGTSNLSVFVGLKAALDFYRDVGPARIFARIHQLAARARERLAARKDLRIMNASADAFYAGIVTVEAASGDLGPLMARIDRKAFRLQIDPRHMRVATHVFLQPREIDAFFAALPRS